MLLGPLAGSSVGNGSILAFGKVLAFGAMVACANVLEETYDWFKACQAATQFIASHAGVYYICQNIVEVHSSWS